MDTARIAELLQPFLAVPLEQHVLERISTYIDILLRWNRKLNLTAVRGPEQIVTRHFGESLFAAQQLFAASARGPDVECADVGSGAGFPGIPIKLCCPELHLSLIESNQKKAVFLREVVRSLTLSNVDVFTGRAEDFPAHSAAVVTLRAVEHFEQVVPVAARLLLPRGRLALLIGERQFSRAAALPHFRWIPPIPIPQSSSRILLLGSHGAAESF
jgi:16S rRNA (guanine527-N7)-methyltransferase